MNFPLALAGFEVFVPEERVAVSEIINDYEGDQIPGAGTKVAFSDFMSKTMGLQSVSKSNISCQEMVENTIDHFLKRGLVNPNDIDMLVVLQEPTTGNPINFGQHLVHKFGLQNSATITMGGNHCANIEVALPMLMRSHYKNVLVVCGITEKGLSDRIYGAFGIVGDAAGLTWLSASTRLAELISFEHKVNPALYQGQTGDSPVIENFKLYTTVLDTLKAKSPADYAAIKKIIIQNANPLLPTQIVGMKGLDKNKIFKDNLGRYGHLGPVDSVINLRDVFATGDLESGDKILSLTTGLYGSLAANIFEVV
jgi:3-oxoacyl-[acyl-carrier-protein] synthase III